MKILGKNKDDKEWIFWTTLTVSFILIEHNVVEPLFLTAFTIGDRE